MLWLLFAALLAGVIAAIALRRRPSALWNDFVRALDDDPAREAAADAAGLDLDGNPQVVGGASLPRELPRVAQPPAAVAPIPFRVYVASSWRCTHQPHVVDALRLASYAVYDFRNPPESTAFHWGAIDPDWRGWDVARLRDALADPIAVSGYNADMGGLQDADVCVLVLPCGRSAHLEAGWTAGNGTPLIIYAPEPPEPELMYRMADAICETHDELLAALRKLDDRRRLIRGWRGGCVWTGTDKGLTP